MTDPEQLYAQLVAAFRQCKWREAQELTAQLLPFAPEHAGVYGIAGMTCLELQQLPQAIAYLRRAAELDPSRADFATMLAKALLTNHLSGQARMQADRAMALKPQDPMTLNALGMIYAQTEAHEAAASAFRLAVSFAPTAAAFRFNLATALTAIGDVNGAEHEIETCIDLDPTSWQAYPLLSQLRKQTPERNHLATLRDLLAKHANQSAAVICLNMAIAKEAEDLGNYAEAFRHTTRGKAAARATR
ncbi:MAG: tetratricopeptide repeat protein, partial [Rhodanobacter sp.]